MSAYDSLEYDSHPLHVELGMLRLHLIINAFSGEEDDRVRYSEGTWTVVGQNLAESRKERLLIRLIYSSSSLLHGLQVQQLQFSVITIESRCSIGSF